MSLGNAIRAARERRGMTREELGERAGLPWKSVRNWEQNRTQPQLAALARLAAALGVRADDLLRHVDRPHESSPPGRPPEKKGKGK